MGAPDRHVLCLLRNRRMTFKPSVHLHPIYSKLSHSGASTDSMSLNFRDEMNAFKDGAKWNFAVDTTKDLRREREREEWVFFQVQ